MDNTHEDVCKVNMIAPMYGPSQARKTFVLCFDGTGNKFSGTASDSNILKIFRMLDRNDPSHLHYYQPGIGTYVDTKQLSAHTTLPARFNSWFRKARDSAVGTSFDDHVMGGYKFLMRYYSSGDDIYFFGFSRGAYIARFLAEMLDYVGLLSAGNEEMARFAWKAFARWQQRHEGSPKEEAKKKEMFEFLTGFRETFSRPVRRIRFLGLFDTVNSVPHFENAWMKRSKFPYTARSSARVIRHAVCIDERRAKFRQDLISETKTLRPGQHLHFHHQTHEKMLYAGRSEKLNEQHSKLEVPVKVPQPPKVIVTSQRYRRPSRARLSVPQERRMSTSPVRSLARVSENDASSIQTASSHMASSQLSLQLPHHDVDDDDDADEEAAQDIQEIWFPGSHAVGFTSGHKAYGNAANGEKDVGGGWEMSPGEKIPLSHGPLVWMVREAQKAGLNFDNEKLLKLSCIQDRFGDDDDLGPTSIRNSGVPQVQITNSDAPGPAAFPSGPNDFKDSAGHDVAQSAFHQNLFDSANTSVLHDCLRFGRGLKAGAVMWWNFMEFLPFRRMDLQPDNSWKSISWPLPKGEVRDIPEGAWIHTSALKRMHSNHDYRPGNLIIGGGGRGVRVAPTRYGIGEWEVLMEEGDPIGEVFVRKTRQTESP